MEYIPVGKRTRLQKALKKEELKHNSFYFSSDSDDDDEDACVVIDKSEFLKTKFESKNKGVVHVGDVKKKVFVDDNNGSNVVRVGDMNNGARVDNVVENHVVRVDDDKNNVVHNDDDESEGVVHCEDDQGEDVVLNKDNQGEHVVLNKDDEGEDVVLNKDDQGEDVVRSEDDEGEDDEGGDDVRSEDDDGEDDQGENVKREDVVHSEDDVSSEYNEGEDDEGEDVVGSDSSEDDESKDNILVNDAKDGRKFDGLSLPTYLEKDVEEDKICIGKRTRSHYKPNFPRKKIKHGTLSSPIPIDLDSSSDDDDDEEEEEVKPKSPVKTLEVGGEKKRRGRPPLKKNEHMMPRKEPRKKRLSTREAHNVLLEAIVDKGNNQVLENIESCVSDAFLPLKFRFGAKKNVLPKISKEENETECLFKDLDSALQVCEIGFEAFCLDVQNDHDDEHVALGDSAKSCREGKHCWICDDEIGIKCKFCSLLKLEIKNVMPDFHKNPLGKPEKDRCYSQFPYYDSKVSDRFQFQDWSNDWKDEPKPPDHPISGTVWDLIPGTYEDFYEHQRDGFEFIWRNIDGGIRLSEVPEPTEASRGGCIICHAPGTGKTRLAIAFLQSFMKKYPMSRPVIIAPCNMLRTWEEEFAQLKAGIPFFNLNEKELSGKEDPHVMKSFTKNNLRVKNETNIRIAKLLTWSGGKGVLAISYGLFQAVAGGRKGDKKSKQDFPNKLFRQILLEKPGMLVLDEGHTPRNEVSKIYQVLSKVVTKNRVILSGTPFQNNFEELHNTITLVREEFGIPFLSCVNDDREMLEKLRKQIAPFVHVYDGKILRDKLPDLFHSLVILRPSDLQKMFFDRVATISKFMKLDNSISVTSVHPSIFCGEKDPGFEISKELKKLLEKHKMDVEQGVKIHFLVELIRRCNGERVLVFGQSILSLKFIVELLKSKFRWTSGRELLYIDGRLNMKERQSLKNLFNSPKSEARILLASTKACCEGISLVGASRVVLLDVLWNPSVERQAISRAYRLGQQKKVFVYHLITSGTLEEEKFRRQATKEHFSELLFSSPQKETVNQKSVGSRVVPEDDVLQAMEHHENTKNMFEKIIPQPKADELITSFAL